MIRQLVNLMVKLALKAVYLAQQESGLQAFFLFLPARFVSPTLRAHGAQIGEGVEILTPLSLHNADPMRGQHYSRLIIGPECYLGKEVFLDLAEQIILEERVTVSMRVMFLTHTHAGKSPLSETRLPPAYAPVTLKRGCYIGAGAIILPGVVVGEEAIVGAGAVVAADVPPGTTVAGAPARRVEKAKFET